MAIFVQVVINYWRMIEEKIMSINHKHFFFGLQIMNSDNQGCPVLRLHLQIF